MSKPLVYGLALRDNGIDHVLKRIGVEPSGEAFNSIAFDTVNNRPFNPMVNSGAIARRQEALVNFLDHVADRRARQIRSFR